MCVRSTEILLRRVAAPVIANMSKETEFEKNSVLENWTHCGKKKKKSLRAMVGQNVPFLPAMSAKACG